MRQFGRPFETTATYDQISRVTDQLDSLMPPYESGELWTVHDEIDDMTVNLVRDGDLVGTEEGVRYNLAFTGGVEDHLRHQLLIEILGKTVVLPCSDMPAVKAYSGIYDSPDATVHCHGDETFLSQPRFDATERIASWYVRDDGTEVSIPTKGDRFRLTERVADWSQKILGLIEP